MGAGSSTDDSERTNETTNQNTNGRTPNGQPQPEKYHKHCFFRYITAFARLWGILLFLGLWGCCVQGFRSAQHRYAEFYLLGVAIVVTFLELVWMINKCACCSEESCCFKAWRVVVWVDDWRKSVLYILFAVPCFTEQLRYIFTILAAGLLIVGAFFYFMKSFRDSSCVKSRVADDPESRQTTDTADPKAKLVASEQKTYSSMGQQPETMPVTSTNNNTHENNNIPAISSEPDKSSPVPEVVVQAEEEEEVPVGYKFDYGVPQQTGNDNQRPKSTNPFDEENDVTDSPGDVIAKPDDVTTEVKRDPASNPFDDDEDSFEYKPRQRPLSRNPFD